MMAKETPEEKAIREADEALDRAGSKTGASAEDRLSDPVLDALSDWRDDVDGPQQS